MIEEIYKAYKTSRGICTDTRNVIEGSLFFALKGPSFNANDFAEEALSQGCSAAIVDEHRPGYDSNPKIYLVDNVLHTLQSLAQYHRTKLRIPVIALTGSNGKTTTKELLKSVLEQQYNCLATEGNLNNHIGVPISILSIQGSHEIAVIELGANHVGEIEALCKIAQPDYGLITNIGLAHLEGFGGEEGVFKGKKELFDHLHSLDGVVFANADDPKVMRAAEGNAAVKYGRDEGNDIVGKALDSDNLLALEWWTKDLPEDHHQIRTNLSGQFNFGNVMAAIAVGCYFGISPGKIRKGIEGYVPNNNRSELKRTLNGNTLIIDCYNANPSSMELAIESLNTQSVSPKVCILGDMMELGNSTKAEHQKVIEKLNNSKIGHIYLVGEFFGETQIMDTARFKHFHTTDQALNYFIELQHEVRNSIILLKGSRKMKLERLIEVL